MGAELRKSTRRHISQSVLMVRHDGSIIGQCKMLDVSAGGARLKLETEVETPSEFVLLLSKIDPKMRRNCIVAWRDTVNVGVRFVSGPLRHANEDGPAGAGPSG